MRIHTGLLALLLVIALAACVTVPESESESDEYSNIDRLMKDASWNTVTILEEHFGGLEAASGHVIAVYPFEENDQISERSDVLIDGMIIELANAFRESGSTVSTVNRKNLSEILQELEFQSSDLVDPETQLAVGRQLGAHFIMTGTIFIEDGRDRISFQLLEVETGILIGGFAVYLVTG